jgi:hypothetical protein
MNRTQFPSCPFVALVRGVETEIVERHPSGMYCTRGMGMVSAGAIQPLPGGRQKQQAVAAYRKGRGFFAQSKRQDAKTQRRLWNAQARETRAWLLAWLSNGRQRARVILYYAAVMAEVQVVFVTHSYAGRWPQFAVDEKKPGYEPGFCCSC